jgi:NTE family protein
MLFHLGALWRLNELGYLAKLTRISSVSGGSITAATLGVKWEQLEFDPSGIAQGFEGKVVEAVRSLARVTIDLPAVALGLLLPGSISARIAGAYRRRLLGEATLQALPDDTEGPRFVINATNLQSGVLWRFSKPYMRDYRVGEIKDPQLQLAAAAAAAVAASSAFRRPSVPCAYAFLSRPMSRRAGRI